VFDGTGPLLWAIVPWSLWLFCSAVWGFVAFLVFAPARRVRAIFSGICLLGCALSLWPPYPLGAHSGGIRLTLSVGVDDAAQDVRTRQQTITETTRVVERRIGALGLLGSVRAGPGPDQIEIELLGANDVESAKRVILKTARLSLQLVEESGASREALLQKVNQNAAGTMEVLPGPGTDPGTSTYYLVRKEAAITGRDLKNARATADPQSQPAIAFSLNPTGATRFRSFTERNIGRQLAIVLDGEVQSAPLIQGPIGAEGQISGRFTAKEAEELANVLRAGALPASVRLQREAAIPPTSMIAPVVRAAVVSAVCVLVAALLVFVGFRLAGTGSALAVFLSGAIVALAASVLVQRTLALSAVTTLVLAAGLALERMVRREASV
jgi:protein-export membrane protein SecD